ncbi:hypothetical protein D869_gp082 [Caulobacter phage CcrRogue]|uniref:Uncharacterized protein n=1 Tax=Caulobacter phage CcrRogue TaxID=2927986 RepID=K4K3K2_9CAUD|nr:hypothetical protein D869_gp019 [Caulobacter phage CcrRogue]YP_006989379.1 hypothetical protein D869_gp082 [Caulobacter phage CcrRogue]AFU86501.1 hypothetical protein CcrRogue_gp019 [Caulobacter phage CcrRogue]AFU86832.1 hypothetical protein CcrRogue_gp350 [Caulobacter phage CcrRogue]
MTRPGPASLLSPAATFSAHNLTLPGARPMPLPKAQGLTLRQCVALGAGLGALAYVALRALGVL